MQDKLNFLKDKGVNVKGVVYAGSNDGEEFVDCKAAGITKLMAFEPLTAPFMRLKEQHPDVLAFRVGLANDNCKVPMQVTKNDKASSALSRIKVDNWKEHKVFKNWNQGQWPIVRTEAVDMVRFEDYIQKQSVNLDDYNLLCMDVQGMELEALGGFGDLIDVFDALIIELSFEPVYVGEASAQTVVAYLKERQFVQASPVEDHDDVIFIHERVLA